MTIKEIDKRASEAVAARDALEREERQLSQRVEDLKKQARDAAEAGDVETYKQINAELQDAEAVAFVKSAQLSKADRPVSEEDVKAAWYGYKSEYERALDKGLRELDRARSAFVNAFLSVVETQNEALRVRERCARYIGIEPPTFGQDSDRVYSLFSMKTIPSHDDGRLRFGVYQCTVPEVVYCLASGKAPEDGEALFNSVVRLHQAHY